MGLLWTSQPSLARQARRAKTRRAAAAFATVHRREGLEPAAALPPRALSLSVPLAASSALGSAPAAPAAAAAGGLGVGAAAAAEVLGVGVAARPAAPPSLT